jgi:hypothetical protein
MTQHHVEGDRRRHNPPGNRIPKEYDPHERALFARYRDARADLRPAACTYASPCWVEDGPPSIDSKQMCRGCQGRPRVQL